MLNVHLILDDPAGNSYMQVCIFIVKNEKRYSMLIVAVVLSENVSFFPEICPLIALQLLRNYFID